jgi:hypothetical protein
VCCFACTCADHQPDCADCAHYRADLASALLPLFAAERAAGRRDGLDEGAAALQDVIDRDRAQFPHARGQSRIALGGARQILIGLLIGLLNDHAVEEATGPDADTTGDCPGYETAPNRCTCPCEGCQHNCAAHHGPETGLALDPQGHTPGCADTPGIRGLLEHVGIDTTGRDITVSGSTVDAAAHDSADARADATGGGAGMSAPLPPALVAYLVQRDAERAEAIRSFLASLTDRERALMREAAVMGYVQGRRHPQDEAHPKDAAVLALVVDACLALPDLYPATNLVAADHTTGRTDHP